MLAEVADDRGDLAGVLLQVCPGLEHADRELEALERGVRAKRGPPHPRPDVLETRAVDPRERAEVEHERRGPPARALGPRRGTGPPVAEVARRRVRVERAERAGALGVARASLQGCWVGGDAPELAGRPRGGGELAQDRRLHAGLLGAGVGPAGPQRALERGEADRVHRGDAVVRRRDRRRHRGELLGEAKSFGDGLPLTAQPRRHAERRAQVEVAGDVGECVDVVAVAGEVGGHVISFGSAPTRAENTAGTPGHADASSFAGMVLVSRMSMPRLIASSMKRARTLL